MRLRTLTLFCFLSASALSVRAEVLTLAQAVDGALARGPEAALVASTLQSARAVDAQTQAKAGLTASTALTYQAAKAVNDPVSNFKVTSSASSTTKVSSLTAPADDIVPQSAQGTLTLSAPLTTLTLTGGGTFQVNPDGKVLEAASVGAALNQTLVSGYYGGSLQAAADKSRLTWQNALLTAQAGKNKAVLNVRTAFFTLLAAQARIGVYSQALDQRREALKFTQAKASSGTATSYDLKVAQAAVRSAELDLRGGQNTLTTARARLANLLGQADTDLAAAEDDLADPAATLDQAIGAALANRTELAAADLSARSAAVDGALAAGSAVPTVALTGGVTWSQANALSVSTGTTEARALVGTIGVRITPPTLDAGLAENQSLQARALAGYYRIQTDQLRRSVATDVQDAWNTWQLNRQRLDLARTSVENADINRQILKSQFDSGAKLISDWLTAEIAFTTAQQTLLTTKLTCQTSAATLENLMGR